MAARAVRVPRRHLRTRDDNDVVADGPIAGHGTVQIVTSTETGTALHEHELWHFGDRDVELATIGVTTAASFDPATCTSSQRFAGVFGVVAATGAHTGTSGPGHLAGTSTITSAHTANSRAPSSVDPVAIHIDGASERRVRGAGEASRRQAPSLPGDSEPHHLIGGAEAGRRRRPDLNSRRTPAHRPAHNPTPTTADVVRRDFATRPTGSASPPP